MAQIQKGTTYAGSSPDNLVTYTNLNAHVDGGVLLPGAVTEQTAISGATAADDLVLVSDTSASAGLRKVALSNLIPASEAGSGLGGGGGSPLSVTVDDATIEIDSDALRVKDGGVGAAKLDPDFIDDVTAATPVPADLLIFGDASDSGNTKKATVAAVVALAASATAAIATGKPVNVTHGLGAVPTRLRGVIMCNDAGGDNGYVQYDELDVSMLDTWTGVYLRPAFNVGANATHAWITCSSQTINSLSCINSSSGATDDLDDTKWVLKLYYGP